MSFLLKRSTRVKSVWSVVPKLDISIKSCVPNCAERLDPNNIYAGRECESSLLSTQGESNLNQAHCGLPQCTLLHSPALELCAAAAHCAPRRVKYVCAWVLNSIALYPSDKAQERKECSTFRAAIKKLQIKPPRRDPRFSPRRH